MARKKLTRLAAFKLVRALKESKKIGFIKREDVDDDQVYGVVSGTAGDATVKFADGDMLVGPFASVDDAKAALGPDAVTVGGKGGASDLPPGDEVLMDDDDAALGDPMTEKRIRSNMLRMRKGVVERIRAKVKADILKESESLDVVTDVKDGTAADEAGAGVADIKGGIASFVTDMNAGDNTNLISAGKDSDSDPDAENSNANILEKLVNVHEVGTKAKVDTGIVEAIRNGKAVVNGIEYEIKTHIFKRLA
jgi:hypothetical protein